MAESRVLIRGYEDRDREAVRALFIRVNRELAPAAMQEAFEEYIEQSLQEEIDRIPIITQSTAAASGSPNGRER